jgi:formylglycine-generating enzyme required for sulfatase activity
MVTNKGAKEGFEEALARVNRSIVSAESMLSTVLNEKFVASDVWEDSINGGGTPPPILALEMPEEMSRPLPRADRKSHRLLRIGKVVFIVCFILPLLVLLFDLGGSIFGWKRLVLGPDQSRCISTLEWASDHLVDYFDCARGRIEYLEIPVVSDELLGRENSRSVVPLPKSKNKLPSLIQPIATIYPGERQPGTIFRDCDNCPIMVVMPKGSFRMGDLSAKGNANEMPVHRVNINYLFAVGKFKITESQWSSIMKDHSIRGVTKEEAISSLSWNDAKDFIEKLNSKLGLLGQTDSYRLLSEAEFEYVVRAGTTTKYFFGDIGESRDHVVNGFGLQDVHGMVSEWVEDCWHENYVGAPTDGSSWTSDECRSRVQRGGASIIRQSSKLELIHAASHERDHNHSGYGSNGFRVARTLQE